MPVLPLIDFCLLGGWTALFAGFVLKAVALTTTYRPTILGMSSVDFFLVAVAAMLFAIALAARTWVKSQAPAARAARLKQETMDAWNALPAQQRQAESRTPGLDSELDSDASSRASQAS